MFNIALYHCLINAYCTNKIPVRPYTLCAKITFFKKRIKLTFLVTFRYDLDGITNLRTKFNSPTLRTEG